MSKIKPLDERYDGPLKRFLMNKLYLNTHMNMTDNSHLEIANVKTILEYHDIYIKVKTSTLTIAIWGEKLSVSDYNVDGLVINGAFSSIEFLKE
jgi:hypothetical protein